MAGPILPFASISSRVGALMLKLIPSAIPVRTSVGFQQAGLGFGSGFVAGFWQVAIRLSFVVGRCFLRFRKMLSSKVEGFVN